ncbi:hypothetical protein [Halarchaeum acidiphilum]|nr:hypothetical protein [Halarchaeum acidiphilum]
MSRDDAFGETAEPGASAGPSTGADARERGLRARVRRLFAPRAFLLALVAAGCGLFVGGLVPLVGSLTRFLGLAVATFAVGAVLARRSYLEVVLASALASLGAVLFGFLTSAFLPVAVDFLARHGIGLAVAVGAIGALAGVVGYYFGRDLRDGLTRSL